MTFWIKFNNENELGIGLDGVWFVSLGSPPLMYTPSLESRVQPMTWVTPVGDVGHRGSEALH